MEEERKIEKDLDSELKECRSKLNIIEIRQKANQQSQPRPQSNNNQKPPLEPKKFPNKYQNLTLKKERSHSQTTPQKIQKSFKKPGPLKGRAHGFEEQNIDLDRMTYEAKKQIILIKEIILIRTYWRLRSE